MQALVQGILETSPSRVGVRAAGAIRVEMSHLQSVRIALAVALGGDCLSDISVLRAEPAVFGPVASDPPVSARSHPAFDRLQVLPNPG